MACCLLTVLMLMAVFAFSPINGARRWIKFPGFRIQPSELAKLSLTIFLAYFLERRAGEERSFWGTFVPCAAVTGFLAVLIVAEPDLGTAMMLIVIFGVLVYTAGARLVASGYGGAAGTGGIGGTAHLRSVSDAPHGHVFGSVG